VCGRSLGAQQLDAAAVLAGQVEAALGRSGADGAAFLARLADLGRGPDAVAGGRGRVAAALRPRRASRPERLAGGAGGLLRGRPRRR
jgi:hypothetical protein